ncbi:hypothetical protein MRB53_015899 [Persea americana]|uniref:Uncharacterized protein n=1 Tax=Persea americana TaxID=3435 RepID=A0ACC2M0M1_PERAE|nr:hypothetical protein MRB53_015899 [Persea americana]
MQCIIAEIENSEIWKRGEAEVLKLTFQICIEQVYLFDLACNIACYPKPDAWGVSLAFSGSSIVAVEGPWMQKRVFFKASFPCKESVSLCSFLGHWFGSYCTGIEKKQYLKHSKHEDK